MNQHKQDNKKVIPFRQSSQSRKSFHHDHPISNEFKNELLHIYHEVTSYISSTYYIDFQSTLQQFSNDYNVPVEKRKDLEHQLFWWKIVSQAAKGVSAIDEYLTDTRMRWQAKPLSLSWLKEWNKSIPTFYYVGHIFSDHHFILVDIFKEETVEVIILDPHMAPLEKGEILFGMLLPIGGSNYFPIDYFYHFDLRVNREIATYISDHCHTYSKKYNIYDAILRLIAETLELEYYLLSTKY